MVICTHCGGLGVGMMVFIMESELFMDLGLQRCQNLQKAQVSSTMDLGRPCWQPTGSVRYVSVLELSRLPPRATRLEAGMIKGM